MLFVFVVRVNAVVTRQIRNMPSISIITPVYNASAFLGRCLDLLASMSFRDFEVIVVDDGSDDDFWSVIEDFARRDHRFSRSFQTPHRGLGPARNRGLEIAQGEFVAFVDSDLFCRPRTIVESPTPLPARGRRISFVLDPGGSIRSDRISISTLTKKECPLRKPFSA